MKCGAVECGCFRLKHMTIIALRTEEGAVMKNVANFTEIQVRIGAPILSLWPSARVGDYMCATACGVYSFTTSLLDDDQSTLVETDQFSLAIKADTEWKIGDAVEYGPNVYVLAVNGPLARITSHLIPTYRITSSKDFRIGCSCDGRAALGRLGVLAAGVGSDPRWLPANKLTSLPSALGEILGRRGNSRDPAVTDHVLYAASNDGRLRLLQPPPDESTAGSGELVTSEVLDIGEPIIGVHGLPEVNGQLAVVGERGTVSLLSGWDLAGGLLTAKRQQQGWLLPPVLSSAILGLRIYHTDGKDTYQTEASCDGVLTTTMRLGMKNVNVLHMIGEEATKACVTLKNGITRECRLDPLCMAVQPSCASDLLHSLKSSQRRATAAELRLMRLEQVVTGLNVAANLPCSSRGDNSPHLGIDFHAAVICPPCGQSSGFPSVSCRLVNATAAQALCPDWAACFGLGACKGLSLVRAKTVRLHRLQPGSSCGVTFVLDGTITADMFPLSASCTLVYRPERSVVGVTEHTAAAYVGQPFVFDMADVAWHVVHSEEEVDAAAHELRLPPVTAGDMSKMAASAQARQGGLQGGVSSGHAGMLYHLFPQLCAAGDCSFTCQFPFSADFLRVSVKPATDHSAEICLRSPDAGLLACFSSVVWKRILTSKDQGLQASLPSDTRLLTECVEELQASIFELTHEADGSLTKHPLRPSAVVDTMSLLFKLSCLLQA